MAYNSMDNPYESNNFNPAVFANSIINKNLVGIFGMPFQFLGSVDIRIPEMEGDYSENESLVSNDNFRVGSIFAEKIVARMPLLFLIPCRQKFMDGYNNHDRTIILNSLISGEGSPDIFGMLDKSGRYYSTEFAVDEYYNHVNSMCKELAIIMGVGDKTLPVSGWLGNKKVKDIDWRTLTNESFANSFYSGQATVFYVDGADNLSESFTNNTTESSLASMINGFSDQAKEIKFLLGSDSVLGSMVEGVKNGIAGLGSGLSGAIEGLFGGMLGDIANTGVSTVINGGKLLFPKIWSDSSFDRSYNFEIKLRSPDHDPLSIFLNIWVPYIHLLCMVLPEGMDNGDIIDPNGYMTPFLCKAYMKGMFNIDMGIITNMSVSRGATAQWNDDGMPTQLDISITIEDLYSGLALTARENSNDFNSIGRVASIVGNTAMLDYLTNLAGINLGETEAGRRTRLYLAMVGNDLLSVPGRKWASLDNGLNNLISGLYRSL